MFARLLAGSKGSKKSKALPKPKTSKSKDKRKRREDSESTSSRPIALLSKVGSPTSTAIAELSYTSEGFLTSSGALISSQEIKKIMDNQGKFLRRLDQRFDQLMEKIKGIDECLKEVEDKIFENWDVTNEKTFIQQTVKGASKALLEDSIYPDQKELKEATEDYLRANNNEFFRSFTKRKWDIYYEENIYNSLLKTFRSRRGTLTTKIKDAIFFVFGNGMLDAINTNATPEEIVAWKNSPKTKNCYRKLFSPVVASEPNETYMNKILTKVWPNGKDANGKIAFAVGVAQAMLSTNYEKLTISEVLMKNRIEKILAKIDNDESLILSESEANNDSGSESDSNSSSSTGSISSNGSTSSTSCKNSSCSSTNKQSATETSKRAQKRLRRDVIKESSSRSIAETSEPAQKRPRKDVA